MPEAFRFRGAQVEAMRVLDAFQFGTEEARTATLARLSASGVAYEETPAGVQVRDPWQNLLVLRVGAVTTNEAAATLAASVPQA